MTEEFYILHDEQLQTHFICRKKEDGSLPIIKDGWHSNSHVVCVMVRNFHRVKGEILGRVTDGISPNHTRRDSEYKVEE